MTRVNIDIKGPIISSNDQLIYDWIGMDAVSPKKVNDMLQSVKEDDEIVLNINSGGGSVYDASEIYTSLKEHPAKVTGKIVGIAASAASAIAMAADHLLMAPTGQMMIHNATIWAQGDYRDMDHTSEFLKNVNQTIANAYHLKSGKPYDELLAMMDHETWLTPQQALENKLIDEVMFENQTPKIVANVSDGGLLPEEVINKIRNNLKQTQVSNTSVEPVNHQVSKDASAITTNNKEEKPMNLEDLKNNHPELYKQIRNEAFQEGVKAENSRIKEIEELQMPGNEKLVNAAKFETMDSAEKLAVNIIKAEKDRGQNFLQNRQSDAAALNDFEGGQAPPPANNNGEKELELIQNIWGGRK